MPSGLSQRFGGFRLVRFDGVRLLDGLQVLEVALGRSSRRPLLSSSSSEVGPAGSKLPDLRVFDTASPLERRSCFVGYSDASQGCDDDPKVPMNGVPKTKLGPESVDDRFRVDVCRRALGTALS